MTLGAEIRTLRKTQGMSQEDLVCALRNQGKQNLRDSNGRTIHSIHTCNVESIERWESGAVIPTPQTLQALAYALGPRPEERMSRWEGMRKEEYAARMGKAAPESRSPPSPPVTPEPEPLPAPSGTVDLCMTDGAECVRFDGADVAEAVRRFREFLEFQILPGGGGAVFVSWAGYPKNNAARTDGAE